MLWGHIVNVVRAERLELPTFWFEARRSIQLSYARLWSAMQDLNLQPSVCKTDALAS